MKIQYKGKDKSTRVRLANGEEKVVVNQGDIFEVDDIRGRELTRYSGEFKVVTGVVEKENVEKGAVAGAGKPDQDKKPEVKEPKTAVKDDKKKK